LIQPQSKDTPTQKSSRNSPGHRNKQSSQGSLNKQQTSPDENYDSLGETPENLWAIAKFDYDPQKV